MLVPCEAPIISGGGRIVIEYTAEALLQLIGVLYGFVCGYGVRELISRQHHATSERRRLAHRVKAITKKNPQAAGWRDTDHD